MTPVLLGKDLVLEAWSPKIEDKQVPGTVYILFIYIYIYTFIYLQPDGLTGSVSGVRCPYIDQGFNALSRSSVDHVQRTGGHIQPWILGKKTGFKYSHVFGMQDKYKWVMKYDAFDFLSV